VINFFTLITLYLKANPSLQIHIELHIEGYIIFSYIINAYKFYIIDDTDWYDRIKTELFQNNKILYYIFDLKVYLSFKKNN
jgi:hypothetical protein